LSTHAVTNCLTSWRQWSGSNLQICCVNCQNNN